MMKTSAMTPALRFGLGVSLAVHAAVAVGVQCFRHGPTTPPAEEHFVTVTFVPERIVEAALVEEDERPKSPPPSPALVTAEEPPAPPSVAIRQVPEPVPALTSRESPPEPVMKPVPAAAPPPPAASSASSNTNAGPSAPAPATLASAATGPEKTPVPPSTATVGTRATPVYRVNPDPAYPASARRRRQEGLVLLAVTVTPQGRAARVEVKQSSGHPALDTAAQQAVRAWEFTPGQAGATPVESDIEVPVRFTLKD